MKDLKVTFCNLQYHEFHQTSKQEASSSKTTSSAVNLAFKPQTYRLRVVPFCIAN